MHPIHANTPSEAAGRIPVRRSSGKLLACCLVASSTLHLGLLVYSQTNLYMPITGPQASGINIELLPHQDAAMEQAATLSTAVVEPAEPTQETRHRQRRKPAPAPLQSASDTPPDSNTAGFGSAAAARPGTAAGQQNIGISDLLQATLRRALQPNFKYPLLARRRGWEGIVKVGLRVESDGMISQLHIIEPSKYRILDQAAMDSLRNTGQLPGVTGWLAGNHFDIVLPVEYRLI